MPPARVGTQAHSKTKDFSDASAGKHQGRSNRSVSAFLLRDALPDLLGLEGEQGGSEAELRAGAFGRMLGLQLRAQVPVVLCSRATH